MLETGKRPERERDVEGKFSNGVAQRWGERNKSRQCGVLLKLFLSKSANKHLEGR